MTGDLESQKDSGVDETRLKYNGGDVVLLQSVVIFSALLSHPNRRSTPKSIKKATEFGFGVLPGCGNV